MKRYATALLFGALLLSGQLAHADIIDDAIGNIQRAIGDTYSADSRRDEQYRNDDNRYRQLEDRRRQLDERQRQLDRERRQLDDEERRLEEDDNR